MRNYARRGWSVQFVRQQNFPELGNAAGNPRFDRADGHFENRRDVFVGTILQIEERHGGLIKLVHLGQRGYNLQSVPCTESPRRD